MAHMSLPMPKVGKTDKETIQNLFDAYYMLVKEIKNGFAYALDSDNVTEINTNITMVKSDKGTTEIKGPLLEMYDKQAIPKLRLKQGYALATSDFVFELYNKSGAKTVGIDSNGNGTLSKVTLRNDLTGNSYVQIDSNGFRANDGFKNTVEIDALGKAYFRGDITSEATITGATIRTGVPGSDRIELSGGKLKGVTSSGAITGLYFDIGTIAGTGLADIGFYHNDNKLMEFYDEITNIWIRPGSGASKIRIGKSGYTTFFEGAVDLNLASSVSGLITSTDGYHNHGIPDGTALAITDGATITGSIEWTSSGLHYHNVTK